MWKKIDRKGETYMHLSVIDSGEILGVSEEQCDGCDASDEDSHHFWLGHHRRCGRNLNLSHPNVLFELRALQVVSYEWLSSNFLWTSLRQ